MAFSYGNFNYSVDKIKFKGKLNKSQKGYNKTKIRAWCLYTLPSSFECVKEFPENFSLGCYRFSFALRCKGDTEGIFYISEWYNGDYSSQKESPDHFLIEYNPNKSGAKIYEVFCNTFIFTIVRILSCDLAYDVSNASVSDVLLDTKCDVMTYGKTYNKTLYIAPKEDRSGRVKVYQKNIERESKGEAIEKTLRIEVTLKGEFLDEPVIYLNHSKTYEQLTKAVEHLNSVKIKRETPESDDWKVFALTQLSPENLTKCLAMMSSTPRAKYRKLINESTYYTLEIDLPTLTIHISTALNMWRRRVKI